MTQIYSRLAVAFHISEVNEIEPRKEAISLINCMRIVLKHFFKSFRVFVLETNLNFGLKAF